jgi:asparagine synthase (glutamine-hydrolysing)
MSDTSGHNQRATSTRISDLYASTKIVAICSGSFSGATQVRGASGTLVVWGKPEGMSTARIIKEIESGSTVDLLLSHLSGFFAFVYSGQTRSIVVVDRVASRPIIFAKDKRETLWIGCRLSDFNAISTGSRGGKSDSLGALQLALGGQTVGFRTIRDGLSFLPAGHALSSNNRGHVELCQYWQFQPWRVRKEGKRKLKALAADILLQTLELLNHRAGDRPIVVPLSAGLDSRAIAAGLRHLGRKNVICFSYGLKANHEAMAARAIAEKLGYDWHFIPYTHRKSRDFFNSNVWRSYEQFACHGASISFNSDLPALIQLLKIRPELKDGVFVNGQSGDFISGMHLPTYHTPLNNWHDLTQALCDKHFSLWRGLLTNEHSLSISDAIQEFLRDINVPELTAENGGSLYETSEFYDRQSKYVIGGQRQYEFLELEWDLPFWREGVVDFFGRLPTSEKRDQRLYSEILQTEDWGGVWHPLRYPQRIRPLNVYWLRLLAKMLCAPFGQPLWKRVDHKLFAYWMDVIRLYSIEPYSRILSDKLGHRNSVSWFTRRHIFEHANEDARYLFNKSF